MRKPETLNHVEVVRETDLEEFRLPENTVVSTFLRKKIFHP